MKKLYYRIFYKHILRQVKKLLTLDFSFEKCTDSCKRRKIMYKYNDALFYLKDIGYISPDYFRQIFLHLISKVRGLNGSADL